MAALQVRVDISEANPPIWRRLELGSDVFLDQLHDIIQASFGWTDSHLHRFALGESVYDQDAEKFLCPFDVEEGDDDGVPEQEVRLDEVLAEPGDVLLYEYDYGDGWEHRIILEAVLDRPADAAFAVCVAGDRSGPPEDCGGIPGYHGMLAALTDPDNPGHEFSVARIKHHFGTATFDPSQIDVSSVNRALSRASFAPRPDTEP